MVHVRCRRLVEERFRAAVRGVVGEFTPQLEACVLSRTQDQSDQFVAREALGRSPSMKVDTAVNQVTCTGMRRGARRRLGAVKRGESVICDRCPHAARRAESPRASQRSCVRHTCPVLSNLWRPIDHVRAQRGITSSAAHGCFKDKDSCAKRE